MMLGDPISRASFGIAFDRSATKKAFCEEVQEDTEAVIRVCTDTPAGTSAHVIIAGRCAAKMSALHEVALLLAHDSRRMAMVQETK
eukprot:4007190-Amphidinium_carterae.1